MFNIGIILLIIGACFYIGILYMNRTILSIGYALSLILVISLVETIYRFFTIRCHVEIPITTAEQNAPVTVFIKIINNSILPVGRVDVKIGIHDVLQKKGKHQWLTIHDAIAGVSKHPFKAVLKNAGCHEVEVTRIKLYSLFGLIYINKRCKDFGSILVMPNIYSTCIQITENTRNFMGDAEVYDDFRPGHDPGETFEVREYRQKDKLQSIHWKLSAKMDDLMVKENSRPKACAVVLMLDVNSVDSKVFKRNPSNISAYLELIASISYCLMDAKCPHFVAWYSKENGDIRRIRVDDEESFYLFMDHYLRESQPNEKRVREEYRNKYKSEWYIYDICVNEKLEIYKNGKWLTKLDEKNIKDECEKLELLL